MKLDGSLPVHVTSNQPHIYEQKYHSVPKYFELLGLISQNQYRKISTFLLGSSNCARETYLLRVKRTYSVANSNATCVIYYMRAKEIEGNFYFLIDLQDLLTKWEVLPVVFS